MTRLARKLYYGKALEHVNAVRSEFMMPPLDSLPRARKHGTFDHCAIGEAFELWDTYGVMRLNHMTGMRIIGLDPVLLRYERDFERGELPEIEPITT